MEDKKFLFGELSNRVLACAIEVHRQLGPGLLESAYSHCLAHELILAKIPFEKEKSLPIKYKSVLLDCGYRMDFLVDQKIIVELKSVEKILPIHEGQILSYMRLAPVSVGLLLNFNVQLLKDGIYRFAL